MRDALVDRDRRMSVCELDHGSPHQSKRTLLGGLG